MQSFELWHPVSDAPEFLSGAVAVQAGYNELLIVCDGQFQTGKCLILSFGSTEAFHVYEEFAHRWEPESGLESPPKSSGSRYPFPFLKIVNSSWAANSNHARTFGEIPTHYCVLSLGHFVDILSLHPPQIRWATATEIDSLFDRALQLGEA